MIRLRHALMTLGLIGLTLGCGGDQQKKKKKSSDDEPKPNVDRPIRPIDNNGGDGNGGNGSDNGGNNGGNNGGSSTARISSCTYIVKVASLAMINCQEYEFNSRATVSQMQRWRRQCQPLEVHDPSQTTSQAMLENQACPDQIEDRVAKLCVEQQSTLGVQRFYSYDFFSSACNAFLNSDQLKDFSVSQ